MSWEKNYIISISFEWIEIQTSNVHSYCVTPQRHSHLTTLAFILIWLYICVDWPQMLRTVRTQQSTGRWQSKWNINLECGEMNWSDKITFTYAFVNKICVRQLPIHCSYKVRSRESQWTVVHANEAISAKSLPTTRVYFYSLTFFCFRKCQMHTHGR